MPQGRYGAYSSYITSATRYAALGAPTMYDRPGSMYSSKPAYDVQCSLIYIMMPLVCNLLTFYFEKEGDLLVEWVKKYLLAGFRRRQMLKIFAIILVDLVESQMFMFQRYINRIEIDL